MIRDPYLTFCIVNSLPKIKGIKLHTRLLMASKNYATFWTVNKEHVRKIFAPIMSQWKENIIMRQFYYRSFM